MGRAAPEARDVGAQRLRASLRARLLDVDDRVLIGRYEVGPRLGAGGMGVVYRGWDPKLERNVAIKLVPLGDAPADVVLREARAMASVSHRNVVPVYDVGRREGEAYVVMALMEDGTLTDWIDRAAPDAAEILAKVIEAGRGLVAAHHAGVVHHDFKPGNVLLSPEGDACVSDFGLAAVDPNTQSLETVADGKPDGDSVRGGTVGFCAPERVDGRPGDARSDQYSFCVTAAVLLARSLGVEPRPEAAPDIAAMLASEPPRGLHPRVGTALLRGLSPEPSSRFASMDALLAALRPKATSGWRAWLGAVGVAAAAIAVISYGRVVPAASRVEAPDVRFASGAVETSPDAGMLAALRLSRAARRGDRLDDAEAFARLAWSLGASTDRARAELELEVGHIALERSRTSEAERRLVAALDHAERARWDEGIAYAHIAMIKALEQGPDQRPAALEHERFARAALSRLDHEVPYLQFHLELVMGGVELLAGNLDRAEQLTEAAATIGEAHDIPDRYWALFDLCRIAMAQREYEEGQARCEQSLEVAQSLGASVRDLLLIRGNLKDFATLRGDFTQALAQGEALLPLIESHYGPNDERMVQTLFNVAMLRDSTGDPEGAFALYERAIEVLERWHPEDRLMLAKTFAGLAQAKAMHGDLAEAETWYSKALVEVESAAQGDDPSTVQWRAQLGGIEMERKRPDAALRQLDAAIAAAERIGEPARAGLATALAYRGRIRFDRRELESARTDLLASIDAGLGTLEALHPDQVWEARVLAEVEEARGNEAAAREILRSILASLEAAGLQGDPRWAEIDRWLAEHDAG